MNRGICSRCGRVVCLLKSGLCRDHYGREKGPCSGTESLATPDFTPRIGDFVEVPKPGWASCHSGEVETILGAYARVRVQYGSRVGHPAFRLADLKLLRRDLYREEGHS